MSSRAGRTFEDLRREIYMLMNHYAQIWVRRDKMKMDSAQLLLHTEASQDELFQLLMSTEGIGQLGNLFPMTNDNWQAYQSLSICVALIRLRTPKTPEAQKRLQVIEQIYKHVQLDIMARSFNRFSVVPIIPGQYDEDEKAMKRRGKLEVAEVDESEPGQG